MTKQASLKKTVGQLSTELLQKTPDTLSPIENMREQLTDYDKNIYECIERSKKTFLRDFYVVVITKKERLMSNVLRNYFTARLSCPTPDYDQTLYYYDNQDESVSFLWTIPSKDTCHLLLENRTEVAPAEWELLQFVLQFADGTLFKKAKQLNGESADSSLLEN